MLRFITLKCRNKIIKMVIFNELFSLASLSNTKIRYRKYNIRLNIDFNLREICSVNIVHFPFSFVILDE